MGIALAAGVIGAAGAVGGSLLQASAAKKAAKKASAAERQATEADAAEREKYSQMIQAERWFSEQNLKSNEQAQMNIFGSMGDPSTYNAPSQ
jgi:N-acetyl-gamma-glutamylphosphate reductase